MTTKRLHATSVFLEPSAGLLAMLVQPGYIVLDIAPEDLEHPDERSFMAVVEEPAAVELQAAIKAINTRRCTFTPHRRAYSFSVADVCVIEVDGPSAYVAKVVAAAQQLGLKNLRA